jgi:opacity protein-like surface antigen
MNKFNLFLVVLLALFVSLPAGAQVKLGVIGGLNLANVSTDPDPAQGLDLKNRTAFGVGGVLDVRLTENVALCLEPMYLKKGTNLEGRTADVDPVFAALFGSINIDLKMNANYLEIPAFLKLAFGTSTTKPYLMAGPTLGFRLSAKQTGTISSVGFIEVEEKIDEDIKDNVKSTDFGLGFGAGVSFPAGNNAIFVEGRYALGLSDVNDDPEDLDTKIKTKGIQFMAGITFSIGSK